MTSKLLLTVVTPVLLTCWLTCSPIWLAYLFYNWMVSDSNFEDDFYTSDC